jgi:hypothetical protein
MRTPDERFADLLEWAEKRLKKDLEQRNVDAILKWQKLFNQVALRMPNREFRQMVAKANLLLARGTRLGQMYGEGHEN